MRIIVATGLNTGTAEYQNMGDVAMLQVAVNRLLSLWPDAQVEVLTDSPSNLARYCPGAKPVSRAGCECWVGDDVLLGRFPYLLPAWASLRLSELKRSLRLHSPRLLETLIRSRLKLRDRTGRSPDFNRFLDSLMNADLLVVSGSGGFADSCRDWNLSVLGTIEAANQFGLPVAMFGQGMGPLTDPVVFARARAVLPRVSLFSLRGSRDGTALLTSMGVSPTKILTTGDEAIELAYEAREKQPGTAVGVNLRVATYAEINEGLVGKIGSILQHFARQHNAALLPIPIAVHQSARDHETIRKLLVGYDNESDGGLSLDTPLKLVKQVGRCRIVVTGAFHAAVFALAQGIPVVCLSNSSYYLAKFLGLEALFGIGCAVVTLSEPDWPDKLGVAIETTWRSAEDVRLPLLQSAVRQIKESRAAYQRVKNLLSSGETLPTPSGISQADKPESHLCRES